MTRRAFVCIGSCLSTWPSTGCTMISNLRVLLIFSLLIYTQTAGKNDIYSLKMKDIQGNEETMEKYRGRVVLIVNVASECGYTDSHYKGLVKLHHILNRNNKFAVLAFPCNQFGQQEPAANNDIELFIRTHFKAEFALFEKIDVIGSNAHPIYKYLAEQTNQAPDWNFWKYLVDEKGKVLQAWGPRTPVEAIFEEVKKAVEKAEGVDEMDNRTTKRKDKKTEL